MAGDGRFRCLRRAALVAACLAAASAASPYRPDLTEGRFLKVLHESEAQLAREPRSATALAARSQALSSLMRFPEAVAAAQQALDLDGGSADGFLARGLARAGSAVQQGNLGSLRQISGAMDDLRAAVGRDPSLQTAWMTLGLAYQQLPGLLGGSTRRALDCAAALERLAPARGSALRGSVLALDGHWADAEPCFQKALGLAPGDPQVVAQYLEALADKPARKSLGETTQRSRLAAEARRLAPGLQRSARGLEAVSGALLDAGLPEEAWSSALAGLKTVDAPSLLRLQLGKVAARAGAHRGEGLAFLDQVLREPLEGGSGGYPAAHWRRGQILRDLGRAEEARGAAQAALALDPRHRGARRLLEELEDR